jgi:hypothetical protein
MVISTSKSANISVEQPPFTVRLGPETILQKDGGGHAYLRIDKKISSSFFDMNPMLVLLMNFVNSLLF